MVERSLIEKIIPELLMLIVLTQSSYGPTYMGYRWVMAEIDDQNRP
jgi:hypothetical protein